MSSHALTLRLDERRLALLARLADDQGISRADVMRNALDREAAAAVRRGEFDQLVDAVIDENREALDQLA